MNIDIVMSDQVFISLSDVFCCFFGFCFTLKIFQAYSGGNCFGELRAVCGPRSLAVFVSIWLGHEFFFCVFNSLNQHATYLLPFGMDAEGKEDHRQEWPLWSLISGLWSQAYEVGMRCWQPSPDGQKPLGPTGCPCVVITWPAWDPRPPVVWLAWQKLCWQSCTGPFQVRNSGHRTDTAISWIIVFFFVVERRTRT